MVHELTCRDAGYDCDFMIRSESEDQLVEMVQQHAKETHDTELSKADVQGLTKTV
jgi:predicted small metal-binding protein